MPKRFTDRVDPWRLLDQEQVIQGKIKLASMERLSTLLHDGGGKEEASFNLSFHRDQHRRAIIQCEIRATLLLTCQRCLDPMSMPMEIDSRLALVQGMDEAEGLPEELDPLMLAEDGLLHVRELVEDEILLAVPDAPKHREEDCVPGGHDYMEDAVTEDAQAEANPFDILAVLKKR